MARNHTRRGESISGYPVIGLPACWVAERWPDGSLARLARRARPVTLLVLYADDAKRWSFRAHYPDGVITQSAYQFSRAMTAMRAGEAHARQCGFDVPSFGHSRHRITT